MRLLVLDENFEIISPISLYTTLIWIRRYQKLGAFELYTGKENFSTLLSGKYLYRNDREELGVIDKVSFTQDDNGNREVYAKGNFAEGLLYNRVIEKTVTLNGKLETVMRDLVTKYAINPSDSDRVIPHLKLGDEAGLSATIDCQITGANLSEELFDIGNVEEYSHRIRYDFLTENLLFEVWQGKDRRDSQQENSWAIFSNSFYNIKNADYYRDISEYKNVAYVAGETNDDDTRTVIEVDIRTDPEEERRELYVDARDLQSENEDGSTMSAAEYEALLRARGEAKLAEYPKSEVVSSSVDPNANLEYRKDFDLGDYCDYLNTEIGIMTTKRITECEEIYEGSAFTLYVTFGDQGVETIKQLVNRMTT